jgi:hypothetical protein
MSKAVSLFLAGLLFCASLATPVLALDSQSPPAVNAGTLKKSVGPSKLTKEECEGAGGKVESVADCPTGAACFRADQFHVVHVRCLSVKP